MLDTLRELANQRGDRLAALSVDRLADVKEDFDRIDVDTSPYYHFGPREDLGFTARSVLAVASPSPIASVAFTIDGKTKTTIIPPSYADQTRANDIIEEYLGRALHQEGYHLARASALPCKPIAVHAGLGVYGRNDIVYVEGMGSFHSIFLFFSDIPCGGAQFLPLRRMDECENCGRCLDNCPTGALTRGGERVDYDRCLTSINEHGGDFPNWVAPEWHNALIGCVRCQFICPRNKPYLGTVVEIASYDERETNDFLSGTLPDEALAPPGLKWYHAPLPRNLKALLK